MPSKSYSGYLTASETKSLHYVFVESLTDPATDPVVIWFNGGPGCSSLLGFFQENGPIVVDNNGSIYANPYPWNNASNVLYLESPAGVGYSIAGAIDDWKTNDMRQSQDGIKALANWFEKFPEYLPNPLFVSGESYGGVYVPYMTWQIYQYNLVAEMKNTTKMNIQGMMVGNGATNWDFDVSPSFPATVFNFNLIPSKYLDFMTENNCVYYFNDFKNHSGPATCDAVWDKVQNITGDLFWYDLYRNQPNTPLLAVEDRMGKTMVGGVEKTYRRGMTVEEYTPWMAVKSKSVMNDFLSEYVNDETVRTALHIPVDVQGWEMCSDKLEYSVQAEASMWIYPILKGAGIKAMFYSGDTDGAVPTFGTKQWIRELNWEVKHEWRAWLTMGQVSGYIEQYDGLDFITVKGVGHMAPQWAREAVTGMITNWIHGMDI
jgi:carboxypeptidase C (cathepsin A)